MNICIYHRVDLDGYCSAAIWKKIHHDGQLIGMNYGDEISWDQLIGHDVTLVDFCFQPWSEMERLIEVANRVTWIDHHKSAIESWKESGCEFINGLRNTEKAACELTWEFYIDDTPPRGIFLLGDYDCWRHSDPETMPYQMGMRLRNMDLVSNPDCWHTWNQVFDQNQDFHEKIVIEGETILKYQEQQNARSAKAIWFPVEFDGRRWMAVNQGGINSKFWDAVWDESYDGMLGFVRSRKHWTVSLYSTTVDCSEIAKRHGGGGHKGASGFQCQELPFKLEE